MYDDQRHRLEEHFRIATRIVTGTTMVTSMHKIEWLVDTT